jgi:hypothetical protein
LVEALQQLTDFQRITTTADNDGMFHTPYSAHNAHPPLDAVPRTDTLELLPIDFVGKEDQGVIGINDGDELRFEEGALSGLRGLGQHAVSPIYVDSAPNIEQKSRRR